MLRWFFRLWLLLILSIPIGVVGFTVLALESAPRVDKVVPLNTANVERAKRLLQENDPRKLRTGEVKTVHMSVEEITLVLNHVLNRLGRGGVRLDAREGSLALTATFDLSNAIPGRYFNVMATVDAVADGARVVALKLGRITMPALVIDAVVGIASHHLLRAVRIDNLEDIVRTVKIDQRGVAITYRWQEGIVDAVRDWIVSRDDRVRLRAYHRVLGRAVDEIGKDPSFARVLQALFRSAGERSAAGDPIAENRAAMVVLAAYVNGRSLATLVPDSLSWEKPKRVRLRLQGRRDFAQHFATSAALSMVGGGAVADAIGLYKEIEDADGGSGFSFKDLAADKAGTRFGQTAIMSSASARRLQRVVGAGVDDLMLIPDVKGLAENMSDTEFEARFGGLQGKAYEQAVRDIDARIDATPLYQ